MQLSSQALRSELELNQKRLDFYQAQLDKFLAQSATQNTRKPPHPPVALTRWVELYSERVRILERKLQKTGLRTELPASLGASELSHGQARTSAKKKSSRRAS